ncbi:MAG: alpha-amylase, partial [Bacteroidetes bacterium HGW-Bacteroidetes-22]
LRMIPAKMIRFESKLLSMNRLVIYQLFIRLFTNTNTTNSPDGELAVNGCGKFDHITSKALKEIHDMGFTHIWFTGVIEHSTTSFYDGIEADKACIVKGKAGSPYAIRDYYDVAADLSVIQTNRMKEFEALIFRTHEAGLKAIIDFIPNHLARTYKSDQRPTDQDDFGQGDDKTLPFHPQNNFYYLPGESLCLPTASGTDCFQETPARVTGNDCFTSTPSINDWYETIKLNYGIDYLNNRSEHFDPIPDTWKKMNHVLSFWAEKGVDGFRCDMAAMVPVAFWAQAIYTIKKKWNDLLFIAEIYEPWLYSDFLNLGGFDYLYDKVGFYDTLRNVMTGQAPATSISDCWKGVDGFGHRMLNFIENHDEQRIASKYFCHSPLPGIPATVVASLISCGGVMLYNGQEVGEDGALPLGYSGDDGRTSIFDYGTMPSLDRWVNDGNFDGRTLTSDEKKLRETYQFITRLPNSYRSFQMGGFYDLMWLNHPLTQFTYGKVYAFLRYDKTEVMLVAVNFSNEALDADICIPNHATNLIGLKTHKNTTVKELTSGIHYRSTLEPNGDLKVKTNIGAYGFFIGEFTTY